MGCDQISHGEVLIFGKLVGNNDAEAACPLRRCETDTRILQDDTLFRRQAEVVKGTLVDLGCGFTLRDLPTCDHDLKTTMKIEVVKDDVLESSS